MFRSQSRNDSPAIVSDLVRNSSLVDLARLAVIIQVDSVNLFVTFNPSAPVCNVFGSKLQLLQSADDSTRLLSITLWRKPSVGPTPSCEERRSSLLAAGVVEDDGRAPRPPSCSVRARIRSPISSMSRSSLASSMGNLLRDLENAHPQLHLVLRVLVEVSSLMVCHRHHLRHRFHLAVDHHRPDP